MISVAVHHVVVVDHGVDHLLAAVTVVGVKVSVQVDVFVTGKGWLQGIRIVPLLMSYPESSSAKAAVASSPG